MKSKKRLIKRIYYPSGLISLIFLPIMCLWFIHKNETFKEYRILSVNWWSPFLLIRYPESFPEESHPSRNYKSINLTGNDEEDKLKLEQAQLQIRELVKSKDTTAGVHFHFNDHAKFWTFIKAVDICKRENVKVFIPYENDLWVFNLVMENRKDLSQWTFQCKVFPTIDSLALTSYLQEQKALKRKEQIKETKDLIEKYAVSILLFLLMVFLTVRKAYKRRKELL